MSYSDYVVDSIVHFGGYEVDVVRWNNVHFRVSFILKLRDFEPYRFKFILSLVTGSSSIS